MDISKVAGVVMGCAGLVHLVRVVLGWSLQLGPRTVPMWVSVVAGIVLLYLAWGVYHHTHKKKR